jgi:hypothetical protein
MGRLLAEKAVHGRGLDTLFEILDSRSWRWYLVSAQPTKNLPGRKSDVEECQ